uniref:Uncharacterized protein n=1 Tax=Ditylenchus dipsaci TaxID=166011 RepID=A0A915EJ74_9BILA
MCKFQVILLIFYFVVFVEVIGNHGVEKTEGIDSEQLEQEKEIKEDIKSFIETITKEVEQVLKENSSQFPLIKEIKPIVTELNTLNYQDKADVTLQKQQKIVEEIVQLAKKIEKQVHSKQKAHKTSQESALMKVVQDDEHNLNESASHTTDHLDELLLALDPQDPKNQSEIDIHDLAKVAEDISKHLKIVLNQEHTRFPQKMVERHRRAAEGEENKKPKEKDPKDATANFLGGAAHKIGKVSQEVGVVSYWILGQLAKLAVCISKKVLPVEECKSKYFRDKWSGAEYSHFLSHFKLLLRKPSPNHIKKLEGKKVKVMEKKLEKAKSKIN